MVHRLVVSYGQPTDTEAFDAHYRNTHAPLARQMPGLVRFTYGHARSMDPAQPAPYLVAELDFDSEQAMSEAFASQEGRAAAADVGGFATGGASMAHFDVQAVS
jgi:uncharacterized protein (TIGR02118 family)